MIDDNGIVKIIDFDIAKIYNPNVKSENTMGTVGYAPHEQMGIANTDIYADIFAVGVLANQLLIGKHP